MKLIFTSILLFLGAFTITFAKVNKEFVIVIQAGHGGSDAGAQAADGSLEKNYALEYAKELERVAKENNFRIIQCREVDENFDLAKRQEVIDLNKADLFIAIHFNKELNDVSKSGFECLVPTQTNVMENKILGKFLGAELYNVQGMKFNGVNTLTASGINELSIPNTILNLGYFSNANDLAFIQSEDHKKEICQKILNAIMRYKVQMETNK